MHSSKWQADVSGLLRTGMQSPRLLTPVNAQYWLVLVSSPSLFGFLIRNTSQNICLHLHNLHITICHLCLRCILQYVNTLSLRIHGSHHIRSTAAVHSIRLKNVFIKMPAHRRGTKTSTVFIPWLHPAGEMKPVLILKGIACALGPRRSNYKNSGWEWGLYGGSVHF